MTEKIKVVWLCHFSNEEVHNKLNLRQPFLHKTSRCLVSDFAVWITNGIAEIEKMDEVELHVVAPYPYLKNRLQEYENRGVYYHFFQNEDETVATYIKRCFKKSKFSSYLRNRKIVGEIINKIHPDIVHLIGAENPEYSLSFLDVPSHIPTIAQLQTLLHDPTFKQTKGTNDADFNYKLQIEKEIILKASFIGTTAEKYRRCIQDEIKPQGVFLNTSLALFEPVYRENNEKIYDFVYFAANIKKAVDLAIEAFALAHKVMPAITLDVIGGYDSLYKEQIDKRIKDLGLAENIKFEGSLPSHQDVIQQIRKSRFALLPLRIDLTSGTIREAMANGLPVITTDTGALGTSKLNEIRQNVLISEIGNYEEMANNMIALMNDPVLANSLRENAFITASEKNTNEKIIRNYVLAYQACIENFRNGTAVPNSLIE